MGKTVFGLLLATAGIVVIGEGLAIIMQSRGNTVLMELLITNTLLLLCGWRFANFEPDLALRRAYEFYKESPGYLLWSFLLWLAILPGVLVVKEIFNIPQIVIFAPVRFIIDTFGILGAMLVFFLVPIAEELFFRHFLYGNLRDKINPVVASLVAAAAYSIFHYKMPLLIGGAFLVGLLQNFLYDRSEGSLAVVVMTNMVLEVLLAIFFKI